MVRTMTLKLGSIWRSWRVVSRPLRCGMPISTITTSGFSSWAMLMASRPSEASPHTSHPSCFCRSEHKPRRTISWSSANRIRSFMADPPQKTSRNFEQIYEQRYELGNVSNSARTVRIERGKFSMLAHRLHRLHQIPGQVRFHDIPPGPRSQGLTQHLRRIVLSDEQHLELGIFLFDDPASFNAIHSWHGDVEHHHIWL